MSFSFITGDYNVQGSFNKYFQDNIDNNLPTWLTSVTVNFDYPNIPLVMPCFSVTHLPSRELERFEGDRADNGKGVRKKGMVEISGWVDSTNSQNYTMYLRQMKDMIVKLFRENPAIPILNIYGGTTNPSSTGYILRVNDINELPTNQDPNPAVKRVRVQITYDWVERF